MKEQFYVEAAHLSPEAQIRKRTLETDPSSRKSHMEYLPGMEQIESDICRLVTEQMESYDYTKYTARDVRAALERESCDSIDRVADTFARLLSGAAQCVEEPIRRRVLQQMLYHLGRWIYLTDAADDLEKDLKNGNYNPLALRFSLHEGKLTEESRQELAATMDRSVEQMAAAFELADFGDRTEIIRSTVYEGLYAVGNAVLSGTFRQRPKREERNPTRKAGP